ncbi:hypothetical protein [Stackebrandtia nassauensis]|uniref:Uncharacterized protein n=1 Tax=Stackebrandtia nassauensis (strain DSM 44728 / CIP 108903 / NRRL B-16338 / NBRC 102104 / LLR-40K-21) TaxID=446470 RepID=D3Q408_STANL|nr:hypothetical protein [Stackebrandtia nassauensis]ADD45893.1 hypothetical protein Snas_6273 [Stackebrandtia nassauensis DSM 44728]
MSVEEYPPRSAERELQTAADHFDRKKHPGLHEPDVLKAADKLLYDIYQAGKRSGIAPADWEWVTDLPRVCLLLTHSKKRSTNKGLHT